MSKTKIFSFHFTCPDKKKTAEVDLYIEDHSIRPYFTNWREIGLKSEFDDSIEYAPSCNLKKDPYSMAQKTEFYADLLQAVIDRLESGKKNLLGLVEMELIEAIDQGIDDVKFHLEPLDGYLQEWHVTEWRF